MELFKERFVMLSALALTLVASGCVSNSSANLNQDFDTETSSVDLNQTGESILNEAFSQQRENYTVNSKTQVLFNTPVTSFRINLSSDGNFVAGSSSITSTTKIGVGGLSDSEKQEWPAKTIETSGNTSTVTVSAEENKTQETVSSYNRTELGISIEALTEIEAEESELLGATGQNNSKLLIELNGRDSELANNYASIFELHAVNEEEEGKSAMQTQEFDSFNQTKAYAWIDRQDRNLERLSYFGSNGDGALQVRVDARFDE